MRLNRIACAAALAAVAFGGTTAVAGSFSIGIGLTISWGCSKDRLTPPCASYAAAPGYAPAGYDLAAGYGQPMPGGVDLGVMRPEFRNLAFAGAPGVGYYPAMIAGPAFVPQYQQQQPAAVAYGQAQHGYGVQAVPVSGLGWAE